jgi:hypothetical protein
MKIEIVERDKERKFHFSEMTEEDFYGLKNICIFAEQGMRKFKPSEILHLDISGKSFQKDEVWELRVDLALAELSIVENTNDFYLQPITANTFFLLGQYNCILMMNTNIGFTFKNTDEEEVEVDDTETKLITLQFQLFMVDLVEYLYELVSFDKIMGQGEKK